MHVYVHVACVCVFDAAVVAVAVASAAAVAVVTVLCSRCVERVLAVVILVGVERTEHNVRLIGSVKPYGGVGVVVSLCSVGSPC